MTNSIVRFAGDAALILARDARIAAIRWDVIPWGLVLDLDSPISEARDAPMKRAWLVFSGLSELTLPLAEARIPSGVWIVSEPSIRDAGHGFHEYRCQVLAPQFNGNKMLANKDSVEMMIRAQGVAGFASRETAVPFDYGLTWSVRTGLCSDLEMLHAIGDS